uniref:Uncharacterized protein n=1 Tax=Brucella abortus TaxID=235 RepID=Q9RF94_BRUAO|nr:hypothetical protein [Brucella abortus]
MGALHARFRGRKRKRIRRRRLSRAMSEPKPIPAKPRRCLRPRDAASLLLVDRSGATPRILMGRRHSSLAFMPGKFVFPAGRAGPADGAIAAASELSQNDTQKLLHWHGCTASLRRPRARSLRHSRNLRGKRGLHSASRIRPYRASQA